MTTRVGVIGAGSWGTALAKLLADKGLPVTLWAYEPEVRTQILQGGENEMYLAGAKLPENLVPTNDLGEAVKGKEVVLAVVPSHAFRKVMAAAAPEIDGNPIVVTASKGIEDDTSKTMAEILEEVLPKDLRSRIAAISGPSFAREVAQGMPTAVTAASADEEIAKAVQRLFTTPFFRVYYSQDVAGVEIGGAVKNVMAIGAGMSDGLGFGHNARAGLITRGLAEMMRLAAARGADVRTLAGLAGMGDLILTCTGDLSRNRTVGLRLGRGEKIKEILADMKMVAEGVRNARSVHHLARKLELDMPITEQMYSVLHEDKDPRQAVVDLMSRELRAETD